MIRLRSATRFALVCGDRTVDIPIAGDLRLVLLAERADGAGEYVASVYALYVGASGGIQLRPEMPGLDLLNQLDICD